MTWGHFAAQKQLQKRREQARRSCPWHRQLRHVFEAPTWSLPLPCSCWSGGTALRRQSWETRRRCPRRRHPRRCCPHRAAWSCRSTSRCARCAAAAAQTPRCSRRLATFSATRAYIGRCRSGGAALSRTCLPGWTTCAACTKAAELAMRLAERLHTPTPSACHSCRHRASHAASAPAPCSEGVTRRQVRSRQGRARTRDKQPAS